MLSSSSLALIPNPSHSLSPLSNSNPNPLLRVFTKPCSIQAVRFYRTQINPTASHEEQRLKVPLTVLGLAASAVPFLGFGFRICSAASTQLPPVVSQEDRISQDTDDKELEQAFEKWKSKTYALTVPLRIVSLQGSMPQSWVKDFMRSQGKRLKLQVNFCGSLEGIFSKLSMPFIKVKVKSASYMAADLVGFGDSWLSFAIKKGLIESISGAEEHNWFKCLSEKWKEL